MNYYDILANIAETGNLDTLGELTEDKFYINGHDGNKLLHYLSLYSDKESYSELAKYELIKTLINTYFINIYEYRNNIGNTIFHILAMSIKRISDFNDFLNYFNIDPIEHINYNGSSIIHYIAKSGNYHILKYYIIKYNINIHEFKNYNGYSLLHYFSMAFKLDLLDIYVYYSLKKLISDYNINIHTHVNNNGNTIAFIIAFSGNYEILYKLINEFDINVLYKNKNNKDILYYLDLGIKEKEYLYKHNLELFKKKYEVNETINNIKDNKLKVLFKKYFDLKYDNEQPQEPDDCPICLEKLEIKTGSIVITKCKHTFHLKCLFTKTLHKCPLCRSENYY